MLIINEVSLKKKFGDLEGYKLNIEKAANLGHQKSLELLNNIKSN
jgi:hypothetical protein